MTLRPGSAQVLDEFGNPVRIDSLPKKVVITHSADVDALLDANKRDQKERQDTKWRHQYGRVNKEALYMWAMQDGLTPAQICQWPPQEFFAWVKKKLRSRDNAHFRTTEKRF